MIKYELTNLDWGVPLASDRCQKFDILGTFGLVYILSLRHAIKNISEDHSKSIA